MFTIRSRKSWLQIVSLGMQLAFWAFFEILLVRLVLLGLAGTWSGQSVEVSDSFSALSWFLLLFLALWTIGGARSALALMWQLSGQEIVDVSERSIRIKRQVIGLGRWREYLAEHIQDLRVSPEYYGGAGRLRLGRWRSYGIGGGMIVFDYGARTFGFGSEIDTAEGKQILSAIQARFPEYRADGPGGSER